MSDGTKLKKNHLKILRYAKEKYAEKLWSLGEENVLKYKQVFSICRDELEASNLLGVKRTQIFNLLLELEGKSLLKRLENVKRPAFFYVSEKGLDALDGEAPLREEKSEEKHIVPSLFRDITSFKSGEIEGSTTNLERNSAETLSMVLGSANKDVFPIEREIIDVEEEEEEQERERDDGIIRCAKCNLALVDEELENIKDIENAEERLCNKCSEKTLALWIEYQYRKEQME